MKLRNESLSVSLAAAQSHISTVSSSSEQTKDLQTQVEALTAELNAIGSQFHQVWSILPTPSRRAQAGLVDARTGLSNASLTSPSTPVNFGALQDVYRGNDEKFQGIAELVNRVRSMADDGKLLVERIGQMGKDRELFKNNALKAKKLVEDSTKSLETYQQCVSLLDPPQIQTSTDFPRQVAILEDRLASTGTSESRVLYVYVSNFYRHTDIPVGKSSTPYEPRWTRPISESGQSKPNYRPRRRNLTDWDRPMNSFRDGPKRRKIPSGPCSVRWATR